MARVQWKSKRTLCFAVGIFVLYFLARVKHYEYEATVFLPKVHPNAAWEFVADFSNMKYLNPTIIDFNIISESGNYDQWKYSTEYSEHLSHWPYLKNLAVAHFNIKANPNKDTYFIHSTHRTCLFMGLFCLDSTSEFKFTHNNFTEGTLCEETILYQCPSLLSSFCKREVAFQRNAIMSNLKSHFKTVK